MVRILIVLALLVLVPPAPVVAEEATVLAQGTYVAPRKGRLGKRKRIADPTVPGARTTPRSENTWFWRVVSPSMAAADATRWAEVLAHVEAARGRGRRIYGSRRVSDAIWARYGDLLQREAERTGLSVPFLIAVIAVESNGVPTARSPVGAGGLMQLMPQTASRFGVTDRYDPDQNIRGGATYLDWLLGTFGQDAVLALAGYNAGEGAVAKYDGVPPFRETRDYVAKVAGAFLAARHLCAVPPVSPRQVCVREG